MRAVKEQWERSKRLQERKVLECIKNSLKHKKKKVKVCIVMHNMTLCMNLFIVFSSPVSIIEHSTSNVNLFECSARRRPEHIKQQGL